MEEREADREAKAELGRRIFAALMSYQLNLKSVDYTMKTYISNQQVDPSWGELGWALLEMMAQRVRDAENR